MSNLKNIHQSVFKGIIEFRVNDKWDTIGLKQDKNNFTIDLVARVSEVLMNMRGKNVAEYKISLIFASEPIAFEQLGDWQYEFSSHYISAHKSSYEVKYFDDWEDTKYTTKFYIGSYDLFNLLKNNVGRWVYILFEIKGKRQ